MFRICLSCHQPFPGNETLEHFQVGKRVAYDPDRGRLWAVCPGCRRWTLAPIEDRWEALEELERAVTDRARLLSQTDHIALLRHGDVEIVRVGRAGLQEESWWRYGRELIRRRKQHKLLTAAGIGTAAAVFFAGPAVGIGFGGFGWGLWHVAHRFPEVGRWWRYGKTAWRGDVTCPRCGATIDRVPFKERGRFSLAVAGQDTPAGLPGSGRDPADGSVPDEGEIQLVHRCYQCGSAEGAGQRLTGAAARHVTRRILAYDNFAGAEEKEVGDATRLITDSGSAGRLTMQLAAGAGSRGSGRSRRSRRRGLPPPDAGTRLGDLHKVQRIALEIAVNEENERRLLELELAALEDRWREEEELASIIDGELTPVQGFSRLVQDLRGGTGLTPPASATDRAE